MFVGFRVEELLTRTFTLNVFDQTRCKDYSLKFPGTKTIGEVKADVFSLTDIPVRHQVWTGWPSAVKDDSLTLAMAGLTSPIHSLSVRKSEKRKEYKRVCYFIHIFILHYVVFDRFICIVL